MKTLLASASTQAMLTKMARMRTKVPGPMPLARMAVTSLSAASRLSPIRIPTSTPMGMVTVSAPGMVRKKISATLGSGALLRTTTSRMRSRSRRKITKVNIATPIRACESTSLRM